VSTVQEGIVDSFDTQHVKSSESPKFIRRLLRRPLAALCVAYLLVIIGIAIVAPIVLPGIAGEQAGNLLAVRQGPTWHHLLGTDTVGRDVLERLLVGTRVTMVGVAEAFIVALGLGVPLGMAAAFLGGWADRIVGWLADLTFSMPAIIVILVVLSVFPQSMLAGMASLGIIAAPGIMRVVRSATLPVREELYIAAARVSGLSRPYIVSRHVFPKVAGAIIVQATLLSAAALLVQSGLSFLNLLVAAPAPSWGGMITDGMGVILFQPWLIWPPGIAIFLTILALGLLGDAVRDATVENWSPPIQRRRAPRPITAAAPRLVSGAAIDVDSQPTLLSVEGLTVAFRSGQEMITVVEDVNIDIRPGETMGLVGETGCGKTVTALSVIGMLRDGAEVTAGRVMFEGRNLTSLSERELSRVRGNEIGLISQEPMISLNPVLRVGVQLAEVLRRHHGISRRDARARTIELLQSVRLPDAETVARRYPHELSGGMAQRVAIARALAGGPKLLIADEPTTALDVTMQAEILDLLRDLQSEREMAILLVTHDWGVVADICDRAVVMYSGQIVERAQPAALFREPLHPYTKALLAANPHSSPGAAFLPTIPGQVPKPGDWPVGCHFHPRCGYATDACRRQPIRLEQLAPGRETRCIHYDQLVSS
jgi:peptide/nickel transport system permease protein